MPFGLKNATATYSRALSQCHVLRGLLWTHAVMYVDDCCVLGDTHEEKLDNLHKVLMAQLKEEPVLALQSLETCLITNQSSSITLELLIRQTPKKNDSRKT